MRADFVCSPSFAPSAGAMVALCLPEDVGRVAEAVRRAGGYPYVTRVAGAGLRVEYFEA